MGAGILLTGLFLAQAAALAGVQSRDWADGKLTLYLDDGTAEVEWISSTSFRYSRGTSASPIRHQPVTVEFEDTRGTLKMRGRYMTVEVDKASARMSVSESAAAIATLSIDATADGVALHIDPVGTVYGLSGPGDSRRFFFTNGYGVFVRTPRECRFQLDKGLIEASGSSMEVTFYYGPSPKEIFEQHQRVTGRTELTAQSLLLPSKNRLPLAASALPDSPLDSWDALSALVKTLDQWSLSAVLFPALDLATINATKGDVAKRAADLAAMLPILYGDARSINLAARERWEPYLATYLREAFDRGYPLIRPLPVEFSRDNNLARQPEVFMLGDEVLLAPVVTAGSRRKLQLPRGLWTDLRTNVEYKGNQSIELEAPAGQVPTLARNGAVFPLAAKNVMELHYFPDLGGEFFLWETGVRDNSQFHAAPAGEFTRVEIESKVARTYEWVIHHSKKPSGVEGFKAVKQRGALIPGTWWFDNGRKDLHVMVHADAGADKIVNISF